MIRTNYDPEADVLHIALDQQGVRSDSSEEVASGVIAGFDPNGNPIGVEVITVRRRNCAGAGSRQVPLALALPASEQPFDIGEVERDVGRAAVIALAAVVGGLHLAQQCVHLGG